MEWRERWEEGEGVREEEGGKREGGGDKMTYIDSTE